MNTPDPMKSIFDEYTGDVTAATDTGDADRLWRKAKRRRVGRVAVAGVAALALAAPATWLLANTAGAGEPQQPLAQPGAPESTAAETSPEETPPAFEFVPDDDPVDANDIIGATVDMPSFVPGDQDVEAACGSGDTVVADGTYHGAGVSGDAEEGEAFLLLVTTAVVTPEDRADVADGLAHAADLSLVAYFGCDAGDEFVFQVVVLEESGDGTWGAQQLVHSQPGGTVIKGAMAGDGLQLLVGFAERWDPTATSAESETEHWIESVQLEEDGTVVREPSEYDYWSLVIDSSPMFSAE
ncbi:hypothetical protein [Glycomyces sp. NPDC021274]|uniref:hypothetical protein n=1 Tax=Glycomyces sp. NPDC021274 TaxID=3155120 RepID=UPI0034011CF7